ncbi:major Facilitator Superfamily with SPX (SYG1/Pho81/XPR1) domain-containing protein [Actinidia rufa]|uniref:Major Facilitator Superfamily with SPX (SYG1/Pho81/XPR1) domain-containing protein n=1 Tax=Actinidia rufa TaxID=165716 RepID=A0A7J0FSU5_9ERIC|nr:major Facilitator Superfamily with SPX (SYG1/Pho81/XPR1) domain-containing protein [Actinidia rufa]
MKKKVKQYAHQIEIGALEHRHVLKDFSKMLDNQIEKIVLFQLEQQGLLASRIAKLGELQEPLYEEPDISKMSELREAYRAILKKFDKRFGYRFTDYYVKTRANHPYSQLQQVFKHVGLGAVVGSISRNLGDLQNRQGSYLSIYDQPALPLQVFHYTYLYLFLLVPTAMLVNLGEHFLVSDDYSLSLGAAATVCGIVIGAMAVAQIFASVYFSAWSNKSYFKPLVFSSIILIVGNIMYALAYDLHSIAVLLIGRLFCGFGSARAVNRRYISDCVPLKTHMQASAGFVSASALGMACGPALAGLLQTNFKIYKLTFNQDTLPGWVMSIAWLIYLLWLWIAFKEPSHETEEKHGPQGVNADQKQSDVLEKGLVQPLLLGSQDNQQAEDADQECDGSEEAPEKSRLPATSVASVYRLLTPSVKIYCHHHILLLLVHEFSGNFSCICLGLTVLPVNIVVGTYISNMFEDRLEDGIGRDYGMNYMYGLDVSLFGDDEDLNGDIVDATLYLELQYVGVNLSLLSRVMSSRLSRRTYNGGLLSTEAGTQLPEGGWERGYVFWGSAMVLVRAPRDLTESGLELVAVRSEQDRDEPSSSHGESPERFRRRTESLFRILIKSEVLKKWRLSIPPDSSRRDEALAPNRFQIGVQTSPHAPFEVRRVRSTHPTRARGRRQLDFTRHAPPRAWEGDPRADRRSRAPACAPTRPTRQASGGHSQHAPARARTRQESGGNAQARAPRAQPTPASRAEPICAKVLSEFFRHSGFIREVGFQRFCFYFEEVKRQSNLRALIMLSNADYAPGKPRMRNEMNKKMIGHIRQCIGHEHDETSAHGMWTKLKEMDREKTSHNKALMRRLVLKLQRGNIVAEQTSEFQRATRRGQKEGQRRGLEKEVTKWRNTQSFQGKQEKLQEKEDWKAIPTEGECPDKRSFVRHSPVVLARRMDEESNRCTEARKASAGIIRRMYLKDPEWYRSARRCFGIRAKVWPDTRRCNQCRMSMEKLEERDRVDLCTQGRRDGVTTTCKATYFAAHPGGGAGHLSEKVQALRFGSAFTSWEVDCPLKRGNESRILSCRSYRRAGPEVVRIDDLRIQSTLQWLEGEIRGLGERLCIWGECYGASESTERSDREWARIGCLWLQITISFFETAKLDNVVSKLHLPARSNHRPRHLLLRLHHRRWRHRRLPTRRHALPECHCAPPGARWLPLRRSQHHLPLRLRPLPLRRLPLLPRPALRLPGRRRQRPCPRPRRGTALNAGFYTRAAADYMADAGWGVPEAEEAYRWVEGVVTFEPAVGKWQAAVRDGLVEAGVMPYNGFTYEHLVGTKVGGTIFDRQGRRHTAADLCSSMRIPVASPCFCTRLFIKSCLEPKGLGTPLRAGESRPMAFGVIFRDASGAQHNAYLKSGPNNEIIISSGALGSPQLLMLSGVGPAAHLKAHNITMVLDQPMVGQGMADNPMNAVFVPSPIPVEVSLIEVVGITDFGSYIEAASGENYAGPQSRDYGMFSPKIGQLSTVPPKHRTQEAINKAVEAMSTLDPAAFRGGFILEKVMGPLSTGHLELRTLNPNDNPSVTFNYFNEPEDLQRCIQGIETIEKIVDSEAFSKFRYPNMPVQMLLNMTLNSPVNLLPKHVNASISLGQFCKDTVTTIWHYHGGCQVGRWLTMIIRYMGVRMLSERLASEKSK